MSNAERVKRGFTTNGSCAQCQDYLEDVDHIFRKCEEAKRIWSRIMPNVYSQSSLSLNFEEWLILNLHSKMGHNMAMDWNIMFAITLWGIWNWRNKLVFEDKKVDERIKVDWIRHKTRETRLAFASKRVMPTHKAAYATCRIKWTPPPAGWKSINVDGSCNHKDHKAGGGGIMRDDQGRWIMGFMHNIGWCSIEEAECWAAFKGLELAWNSGYKQILFEIDSAKVVNWLTKEERPSSSLINLVSACKNLLERKWETRVNHIYREQNRAVDFLELEALKYNRGYTIVWAPPIGIQEIIEEDRMGIGSWRKIRVAN